ncbi:hypothetical protein BKA65DRAFT_538908 [Rhexocercosporidium sp. MPI-PUGE-AT-0058]|nr:hypothetical protein BKA65DRAFT_538908 [Rhexocercosporidium sp. MPI-PUGE-AT-0058]
MGYFSDKYGSNVYIASNQSPGEPPYSASSRQSDFASLPDLEKKDQTYKRIIRVLRLISRLVSLILNAFMIGILSFALTKYYLTRNNVIAGNQKAWVTPTTLWPTFMLLGIAAITFFMNLVTLCSYTCGVGAANKSSTATTCVEIILLAVHVVSWAVAAGLYRMAETGTDLWGYTCSSRADEIESQVKAYVSFGKLCNLQTGAWYASILQAIAYLLTFIITLLALKRIFHKKKMQKVRDGMAMELGHNQNTDVENAYSPGVGRKYVPLMAENRG